MPDSLDQSFYYRKGALLPLKSTSGESMSGKLNLTLPEEREHLLGLSELHDPIGDVSAHLQYKAEDGSRVYFVSFTENYNKKTSLLFGENMIALHNLFTDALKNKEFDPRCGSLFCKTQFDESGDFYRVFIISLIVPAPSIRIKEAQALMNRAADPNYNKVLKEAMERVFENIDDLYQNIRELDKQSVGRIYNAAEEMELAKITAQIEVQNELLVTKKREAAERALKIFIQNKETDARNAEILKLFPLIKQTKCFSNAQMDSFDGLVRRDPFEKKRDASLEQATKPVSTANTPGSNAVPASVSSVPAANVLPSIPKHHETGTPVSVPAGSNLQIPSPLS